MVAVFSFGRFFEVPISLGDCLGLAAIVLLMREPAEFHSLSFQLSFSAVLGIALFLPRFRAWIPRNWHPLTQKILLSIGVTAGASLGTLPLVAWRFQEFAWVGFFEQSGGDALDGKLGGSVLIDFGSITRLFGHIISLFR